MHTNALFLGTEALFFREEKRKAYSVGACIMKRKIFTQNKVTIHFGSVTLSAQVSKLTIVYTQEMFCQTWIILYINIGGFWVNVIGAFTQSLEKIAGEGYGKV